MNPRKMIGAKAWSTASHKRKIMAKRLAEKHIFLMNMQYDFERLSAKPLHKMKLGV